MQESTARLTGQTKVVALIGDPVEHSLSPAMQNAAFAAQGLDWAYVALPVKAQDVGAAVAGLRALGFQGANVTMPHKAAVIPHLDAVAPGARLIGAVNTVVRQGDRLVGENTDGQGFIRALREKVGLEPRDRRAFLFGAGGVARALAVELARAGAAQLTVTNRTLARAQDLAAHVTQSTGCETLAVPWEPAAWAPLLREADIIINGTRAGMLGEPDFAADLPWADLKSEAVVCDVVYEPQETNLLRRAAQQGLSTVNGLALLLYQGVLAFEFWTSRPAPVEVMVQALQKGDRD